MTLDELRASLAKLDRTHGVARVKLARELSDAALAVLAAVGDEAVWQMTRFDLRREVAEYLGVSEAAIGKAVRRHNAREKALPVRTETDRPKQAARVKRA
jgi:hypothetical protein